MVRPGDEEGAGKNGRPNPMALFFSRSTRALWREGRRTPAYSLFDALHGHVYARWPYLYIGIGVGEHPLAPILAAIIRGWNRVFRRGTPAAAPGSNGFADGYHGKVMPVAEAKRLVLVNEEIRVDDLEQVIPYARARSIILQNPDHIVALQCPCRSARAEPCQPLDVCLIVGEPFASFVADHHRDRARRISQAEAAAILEAEHERGHVHHAFFKDAMLQRFYAICNCCSCCCGAIQAMRNGTPMLASSGYVSRIDEDLCIGCGDCITTCQFDALFLQDSVVAVDEARCMGCGVCVTHCNEGAPQLVRAPEKGEPLRVAALLP
jgi:ferredoxin